MALTMHPTRTEDNLPLGPDNSWDNLPMELFEYLLSRLSVKVLARCRFVCKVWLRIVDSMYPWMKCFNPEKTCIFGCSADDEITGPIIYAMIEKGDEMMPEQIATFPELRGFRHGLPDKVSSSDGLILLVRQDDKSRILESAVINPWTKQMVVVPGSPYQPVAFDNLTVGYDPWSGSHKLVQLLVRDENDNLGAAIYNLRGGKSWRFIPFPGPDWLFWGFENHDLESRGGFCISENLHWILHGPIGTIMVCFDLSREKFLWREMPWKARDLLGLWDRERRRDFRRYELANEGSCLTLWDLSWFRDMIEIWRLVRERRKKYRWKSDSLVFLKGTPIRTTDNVTGVYHYGRDCLLIQGRNPSTRESLFVIFKDPSLDYWNGRRYGTNCTILNDKSLGRLNLYSQSWDFSYLSK